MKIMYSQKLYFCPYCGLIDKVNAFYSRGSGTGRAIAKTA